MENTIRFIINADGTHKVSNRGILRALSQYDTKLYIITPLPLETSIRVNYLIHERHDIRTQQYLTPVVNMKGCDLVSELESIYQEVADWNVFGCSINPLAYSKISKYRSGRIGISFTISQVLNVEGNPNLTNYKGLIGSNGDIPSGTYQNGDYFECDTFNFFSQTLNKRLTQGSIAYFKDNAWHELERFEVIKNTTTENVAVDPACLAETPPATEETINEIIANYTGAVAETVDKVNYLDIAVQELDNKKLNITDFNADKTIINNELVRLDNDKANKNDTYTKTETDSKIQALDNKKLDKTDLNLYETRVDASSKLETAKTYTDTKLTEYYTKDQVDNKGFGTLDEAKTYTDTVITNLIDGAPENLDTFKELADYVVQDQTATASMLADIQNVKNNKVNKNANIAPGTHTKITYDAKGLVTGGEYLDADDIPNLNASKINDGTFDADRIPSLDADKIGSGTFNADRIPSLDADKIGSGTFDADRIPYLLADHITAGVFDVDRIPYLTEEKIPDLHANRITAGKFSVSLIPELEINQTYGLQDALDTLEENKQDKLVPGYNITIDEDNVISAGTPDSTSYFNYASSIYGDKYNLFPNAWLHSLTVDPSEIGTSQYPMGETYGVIIPHGVTTIGANAFKDWNYNQPLVIPNSVTSIGNSAFSRWYANKHPLVIPGSVTTIERFAFYDWNSNNQPLTIKNGVTTIGSSAFNNWRANNHPLVIPNSVTSIGNGAFQDWTANNQPLTISNSVTSIGEFAFIRWESNTHPIIIPNSVTSIGDMAFYGWASVPYVEMQAIVPPSIAHENAFDGQGNAPIYVPDESVDDYKTATKWALLSDRIYPISDKPKVMDAIEAAEQQIADLQENKLNKIWTDVAEQTTTNLTDILIFNRGSNVYKTTVAKLLSQVDTQLYLVVAELPTTGNPNKIYLVPSSDPETQNELDEFIWVDNAWELIGAVRVDLSNYFNKTEINSMLDNKVDKVSGKSLSTNDYTNTDKQSVEKIPAIEQDILDLESNIIDFDAMSYFDYAGSIYGDKYNILESAWVHSLTVDPSKISEDSPIASPGGKAQYPNGETEGVIIPHGVTTIGTYAFSNWSSNNQPLVIPNSVTSIEQSAFSNWTSNNHPLVIPSSVASIGSGAFLNWSSNNQPLTIPNSVTSIGNITFSSWESNNHPLIIPSSVASIGNSAFQYWTANNQPLVIPESITSIETGAFQYWTANNQPLVIPDSVTSIGNYAFRYWSSNTHPLIIPSSVTSIGQYAFENWSSVPYIEIHATTPPTLVNADAFYYQNKAPIYVPDESIDDYKTATNWDMLEYRIFPMSNKPNLGYLNENKLNKVWTDIEEQPTIILTDNLIFNRDSNVYKTTVAKLLAEVDNKIFEIASVLPTTGVAHKIYLVPSSDPEIQNTLDEFIWVGSAWERIGSVSMDLSDMLDGKQDKLVAGDNITIDENTNVISAEVDLNNVLYFNYASSIYGDKYSLLANAWEHSLTVDPTEISAESNASDPRGIAQYPNGETEGVIIPHGVEYIWTRAFYNWHSNNQPLVIPNSVIIIGEKAFYGWTSNNQPLIIPNSVTSIGISAFRNWTSNTHPLVIPSSVTHINNGAFYNWLLVPYIEIHATTPPTLESISAFGYQNNAPIYVPDGSVEAYKTATNWVDLADRIFPISDKPDDIDVIGDIEAALYGKQDKLVPGYNITIDEDNVISAGTPDSTSYFNYASSIYGDKYNLFPNAWLHSLTVDPSEISEDSPIASPGGKAQYPNGETEGVIIPHGVTTIGTYAFSNWSSNNQPLVIPNSVTSIDVYAFRNWTSNTHPLVIPNSVTSIDSVAFYNWSSNNQPLVIPNSVTSIGSGAFDGWLLVPYVEIQATTPPSLAHIGAFANQNDAPIYVPDGSVNAYKTATNWVDLSDRIFSIRDKADVIGDIADLQENKQNKLVAGDNITIDPTTNVISAGGGIETVDWQDVENKPELQEKLVAGDNITIEGNVISASGGGGEVDLNEMAYFNYAGNIYGDKYNILESAWEHSLTVDPTEISADSTLHSKGGTAQYPNGETEGVIIPQGVTSIGKYAFHNWTSNNQPLIIPNTVTSIGNYAFGGWFANNKPLVIPNSVTEIGQEAFYNWKANTHPLIIPNSVTTIGSNAFNFWGLVPYVEIQATTPPTLASRFAFNNQNDAPIYVPDASVDAYKTATNWVDLASRIFPISDKAGVIGDIKSALDAILGV